MTGCQGTLWACAHCAPASLSPEEAADQIREEILAGRLGQGERLVEVRIADALNISRGPVREAFKLLRAEGLLNEEQNRGTYVVQLSSDDVREIYDLRAAIESRAAKLLARSGRPADLEAIRQALYRAGGRGRPARHRGRVAHRPGLPRDRLPADRQPAAARGVHAARAGGAHA